MESNVCVETCSPGYVQDGSDCVACDGSCLTCFGTGSSQCLSCDQSTVTTWLHSDGTCQTAACPYYFYSDFTDHKCKPCYEGCIGCANGTQCLQCDPTGALPYKSSAGEACVASCASNEYPNEVIPQFFSCQACVNPTCTECD